LPHAGCRARLAHSPKDRQAGDCQRPQSSPSRPPGTSACLAAGPVLADDVCRPDGLCRETTPPARPEGYGEKLSFSHRIFAASRLRVKSVISARPAWPTSVGPRSASRGPETRMLLRRWAYRARLAHSLHGSQIAKMQIFRKIFAEESLCVLCALCVLCGDP
jgi:hypothetical protein